MEKGISDIVGVFTDPIIVFPGGGWEETLPEWIKPAITLERLTMNMRALKGEEMTGTDAEALAYMYPASLAFPLDHDWTQIYLYLASTVFARHKQAEVPDDIKVESLNDDQMRDLNRLKAWIYKKRVDARLEKDRAERRQKREEEATAKKAGQPALFDF
ncbi:MAG: hypothetical protein HWN70_12235 [Desulfobacterales bacterium]|nr:hypothetical protein [Desulfobacterales bacterium]